MTEVKVVDDSIDIEGYHIVEGMPGTGLVAKIASDYIIEKLDMQLYAEIYSQQLPQAAIFERDEEELKPPVRIFASQEHGLAVFKSDSPVSAGADEFIETVAGWMEERGLKPVLQSGLPMEVKEGDHSIFHAVIGEPETQALDIDTPPVDGGVGGPTGALLEEMLKKEIDSVCLVIESDPAFPDPEASRKLIEEGIEPLTGIEIDTRHLKESADQIRERKKEVARQLQQEQEEKSSEVYPREMYG